jgi:histidine ammonia-lyase
MGYSGISPNLLEMLIRLYNEGWAPKVHEQGSLGASGDLAPLSELCLPILGMGMLEKEDGTRMSGSDWLQSARLQPHAFHPKEALALINGTQFMLAYGLELLAQVRTIQQQLPKLATLSLSAWQCRADPFFPHPHRIRPHAGQVQTAAEIYKLFTHNGANMPVGVAVQDPYSFRCIPQVHGASYDAIAFAARVFETELNSVTDNPNVFSEEGLVLSAGNFHGQPLALALDFLALALSELGSISERRVYLLISGQRGLPPFLADDPGTDSGYMIAQYSAAALASQNKQLCTPASADSIVSSNGQEDHVSMGANAATKCLRVLENLQQLLGIEFAVASRAISMREGQQLHEDVLALLKHWEVPDHNRVPMESILRAAKAHLFA